MKNTIEEIKKEYQDNIDRTELLLKGWKQVKRLYKKDGSDYTCFNKNFEGADIDEVYNQIHIPCNYGYDTVYFVKGDTITEVFNRITGHIRSLEMQISNYKTQIAKLDDVFSQVDRTINDTISFCKKEGFSDMEIHAYMKKKFGF